jgi:hypothetical protein
VRYCRHGPRASRYAPESTGKRTRQRVALHQGERLRLILTARPPAGGIRAQIAAIGAPAGADESPKLRSVYICRYPRVNKV